MYFFQTLVPNEQKRRKKSENVLSKCVLDLNFPPFKGSAFLIKKKVKFVYPNVQGSEGLQGGLRYNVSDSHQKARHGALAFALHFTLLFF